MQLFDISLSCVSNACKREGSFKEHGGGELLGIVAGLEEIQAALMLNSLLKSTACPVAARRNPPRPQTEQKLGFLRIRCGGAGLI